MTRTLFVVIVIAVTTLLASTTGAAGEPESRADWLALQTPADPAREPLRSDDEGRRALERFLVTRGGLVLPKYTLEIEPEVAYSHNGSSAQRSDRDTFDTTLALRLGLPFDSQAEVRIPYVIHDETRASTASGLGDVQVLFTKELLREREWLPTVLGAVRWQAPTGENEFLPDRLATGTGFNIFDVQVTAVKRFDPVVFVGAVSYAVTLPDHQRGVFVEPGDVFGAKLGGILAISPDTSFSLILNVARSQQAKVARHTVRGSDQVVGTIELGVAQILTRRLLLNVTTEIGVTEDARDLRFAVGLPIRF